MSDQHAETFILRTWDVDRADRLNPAALANFFQEAAGDHAEELGVGLEPMRAEGLGWILSRLSYTLSRRPGRGETLTVRTWPHGTDRLFAVRDYEVLDAAGARIGAGRSGWLVVDLASLRPKRPEAVTAGLPRNAERAALPDGIGPLAARADLAPAGTRRAAYTDLDYNGHVNNARYLQWAQDALAASDLEAAAGFRVDVNYLAEVKLGQSIELFAAALPAEPSGSSGRDRSGWQVEGRHAAGAPAFRAELRLY
jgi:acyl-ACP thioesterase